MQFLESIKQINKNSFRNEQFKQNQQINNLSILNQFLEKNLKYQILYC